jgi:hypothetical protein
MQAVPVEQQLLAHSLPRQDHDVAIEMPILVLDFITTFLGLLLASRARIRLLRRRAQRKERPP